MNGFKRVEEVPTTEEEPKEETPIEEVEKEAEPIEKAPEPERREGESERGTLSESQILGDTPEYSGEDPNAAPSLEVEIPEEFKDKLLDKNNEEVFDESIHLKDAFGNPRYNKDGSFKKKRGRKAKAASVGVNGEIAEGEKPLTRKEANAAARGYYAAFKKTGSIFMGQDFSKSDKETDEYMITLFENVCMKHNSTGLTPEQMLGLGMGEYTLTKYDEPSCKRYLIDKLLGIKNFFTKKKKEDQIAEGSEK